MEVRASYLLVGAVVLALIAGLAAFSIWLVKADIDRQVDRYRIAFAGSVTGLQQGSQVRYRGVPVGQVADVRIDPDNVEQVLVTIDVTRGTPIVQDTVATLEMQGITGIAFVQLRGGTQGSPRLEAAAGELPVIASRPSSLERLFETTPELLARSSRLVERATLLLDDRNLEALTKTLQNLETLTTALARQSDGVGGVLSEASSAARSVDAMSGALGALAADLRQLTAKVDGQVEGTGDALGATLVEMRQAAGTVRQAAGTVGQAAGALEDVAGQLRQPLGDFAATGLYDFTQLVGETRELVAALNRMAKEFERDPAGFFLGSSRRGFEAQ